MAGLKKSTQTRVVGIIAERISARHLIPQYDLVQRICVYMSVTLWNAINAYDRHPLPTPHEVHATCSIVATSLGNLVGYPNELDSWPTCANGDKRVVQLLVFGGKTLNVTSKLQELVRLTKGGEC